MTKAMIVFDGVNLRIPESMGMPKANQMQGTVLERLGELACRICYDSLGVGRPSNELHKHILDVDNTSVYEHCTFTIRFLTYEPDVSSFLRNFLNRKGVWIVVEKDWVDVTVNFRSVWEWGKWSSETNRGTSFQWLETIIQRFAYELAPQIFPKVSIDFDNRDAYLVTKDLNEDQAHVSMWMSGSRGWSHEQVRHRFAMSQRSTRYVDESESNYVEHPVLTAFLADPANSISNIPDLINESMKTDRKTYDYIVEVLETYNITKGIGKTDARKQARGTARGYLGNALATEMIFTASISQWKWMFEKRCSKFADAEIRAVYCDVLRELKASRYAHMFNGWELIDSPDGIGQVLNII